MILTKVDLRKKIEADKALLNQELIDLRSKNAELKKTLAEENLKIRENAEVVEGMLKFLRIVGKVLRVLIIIAMHSLVFFLKSELRVIM